MSRSRPAHVASARGQGFTLVELLIVVAIALLLITLAAPSVRELVAVQRLQSIHAGLVTDLQFARSEAVRRRQDLIVDVMTDATMSCYVIFVERFGGGGCDCRRPPGSVCQGSAEEVRSVQVPRALQVALSASSAVSTRATFYSEPGDFTVDLEGQTRGRVRVTVNRAGRTTSCSPDGSVKQVPMC
jgi:type IV fimbrial biogenesis protein FimT